MRRKRDHDGSSLRDERDRTRDGNLLSKQGKEESLVKGGIDHERENLR